VANKPNVDLDSDVGDCTFIVSTVGIAATFGWGVFDACLTVHYRAIATSGYEFINDGKKHDVAFFPLFSLIIRRMMAVGLPFEVAGNQLINTVSIFGSIYLLWHLRSQLTPVTLIYTLCG